MGFSWVDRNKMECSTTNELFISLENHAAESKLKSRIRNFEHFIWRSPGESFGSLSPTKWSDYANLGQGLPKSIALRKQSTWSAASRPFLKQIIFWDKNSPHLPLFAHFRRTGSQTAHLHLRRLEDSSQITAPPTGSQKGKWWQIQPQYQQFSFELQKDPLFFRVKSLRPANPHRKSRTLVWNSQALHYSKGWHWKPFDMYTGWWYAYPSEKYEFVSWGYFPNIWKK
jgi:hypothetical protein